MNSAATPKGASRWNDEFGGILEKRMYQDERRCKKCEDANDPAKLRAEIDALRKQCAKNEDDAARYRWLRNEHDVDLPVGRISWKRGSERESGEWVNLIDGDDLDRHIDAAMTPNSK